LGNFKIQQTLGIILPNLLFSQQGKGDLGLGLGGGGGRMTPDELAQLQILCPLFVVCLNEMLQKSPSFFFW
jgi:hypothetical protein